MTKFQSASKTQAVADLIIDYIDVFSTQLSDNQRKIFLQRYPKPRESFSLKENLIASINLSMYGFNMALNLLMSSKDKADEDRFKEMLCFLSNVFYDTSPEKYFEPIRLEDYNPYDTDQPFNFRNGDFIYLPKEKFGEAVEIFFTFLLNQIKKTKEDNLVVFAKKFLNAQVIFSDHMLGFLLEKNK